MTARELIRKLEADIKSNGDYDFPVTVFDFDPSKRESVVLTVKEVVAAYVEPQDGHGRKDTKQYCGVILV